MKRKPLGQVLRELGLITEDQLNTALSQQRQWRSPLGRTLIDLGMVDEEAMVRVLSHQLKLPAVRLDDFAPDQAALGMLDSNFCRQHSCLPLRYREDLKLLHIAMSDHHLFDQIRVRARCNLRPYLAGPVSIERAIQRVYLGQDGAAAAPAFRNDDQLIDLSGEYNVPDSTEYYDLDMDTVAPIAGDAAPANSALRDEVNALRHEVGRLRWCVGRLTETLIIKGVCVPDEVSDILKAVQGVATTTPPKGRGDKTK